MGVLRCHLALAEGGVGQLPVAGAVADGVDVRDGRAPLRVGGDAGPRVELDADSLEAEPVDEGPAADADVKVTSCSPVTASVLASLNVPVPLTQVTPLALKRKATPWVIRFTTAVFHSFAAVNSRCEPPSLTPSLPNVSSACFSASAVCTQALVGMQPIRRHVPPSSGARSMQATRAPSCAARIAAV
jgi:hypothetical protein